MKLRFDGKKMGGKRSGPAAEFILSLRMILPIICVDIEISHIPAAEPGRTTRKIREGIVVNGED